MTQLTAVFGPSVESPRLPRQRSGSADQVETQTDTHHHAPTKQSSAAPSDWSRAIPAWDPVGWVPPLVPGLVAAVSGSAVLAAAGEALAVHAAIALTVLWVALTAPAEARREVRASARARAVLRAGVSVIALAWLVDLVAAVVPSTAPVLPHADPQTLAAHLVALMSLTFVASWVLGRARASSRSTVLVAGAPGDVSAALTSLDGTRWRVTDVLLTAPANRVEREALAGINVHVGLNHAPTVVGEAGCANVLILPGAEVSGVWVRRFQWLAGAHGADLHVASPLLGVHARRCHPETVGPIATVKVDHPRLTGAGLAIKSVSERAVAALALVLLAPVLVAVGWAVRRDTPGPALFRQSRIGRGGKPFMMLKFRSMRVGSDEEKKDLSESDEGAGMLFKIRQDPRITPLGRILRKYSIDELPQLWNVVRGEMSLVGPRPPLPEEVAEYTAEPHRRLAVKPGLTGLWQVSGRSDLDWETSVRLDLTYVDNWSFLGDVDILRRTVGAVVGHRGAY